MRYAGSEAYQLDEARYHAYEQTALTPIEGGRLDARARQAAAPSTMRLAAYAIFLAIVLFVAGSVRIALTSATVSLLQSNMTVSAGIKETTALNDDLRITRSLLTQGDRITRIATQNLDMVYASDARTIELD